MNRPTKARARSVADRTLFEPSGGRSAFSRRFGCLGQFCIRCRVRFRAYSLSNFGAGHLLRSLRAKIQWSGEILQPQVSSSTPASNPDDIHQLDCLPIRYALHKLKDQHPSNSTGWIPGRPLFWLVTLRQFLPVARQPRPNFRREKLVPIFLSQTGRQRSIRGSQTESPARQTSVDSSMLFQQNHK
jgi:hypothetical protein